MSGEKNVSPVVSQGDGVTDTKETFVQRVWRLTKTPGSAIQIVIAAVLAIAIGMIVTSTVDDIPEAATVLVGIPGVLWLRALKAVVLPLIVVSMVLAVQRLREMKEAGGGKLAGYTIAYYVLTTLFAISVSCILTGTVWRPMYTVMDAESLGTDEFEEDESFQAKTAKTPIHDVVLKMFESFVPANVVNALATDSLLAVLITSVVVGYLLEGVESGLYKVCLEIERIITIIITFLIKMAPIGVFFLILPNLFKLNLAEIGKNLAILIGCSLSSMAIHLFIFLPLLFFLFTRTNPYSYWMKCAPAWITAWGSASSAATLPVTIKTAIYFPACVVFMAATQDHELFATDYVIICLLSTLASIGTTPIPSSSLVLTVMILASVDVPLTGMFAVIIAIDWFIDRFRTAVNVSGDMFAARIMEKLTGIKDEDASSVDEEDFQATQRTEAHV
ncbi:related to excitatory amino acid transporter [Cephalotrichum gorgonifer]|uniref:Amino acid transporter n=1 Tax=Cephalotrichum gorgonifer TaxID=2041049 RepID=A0AAE8SY92_9PEZI|nr:related to excitatory amino acid transporter [Cephalotrichum gorgonifer]